MQFLVGRYQHAIDDKGRLVLPAKLRAEYDGGVVLTPHGNGAVALFTNAQFERRQKEMLEIRDTNNKEFVFWASRTVAVDVDKQGRFAVPTMLQEWAHLQGDVLIVGSITHLELWNPTRFESYESDDFSGGVTF